jgi:sortase A
VTRLFARRAALMVGAAGILLLAQGLWIPAKAALAQVLLERAFERSLASGEAQKPWPWADTVPAARIEVPRLGVSEVVLAGGSGEALAFGPSELGGTPRDVRVLAGHRDTHFRFMSELKSGDTLVVRRIDGRITRYRVDGFTTVRWNGFAYPASPGRPLLALATCLPNGDARTSLRRVAWAEEA